MNVVFRDATEPRPLASRLLAMAHRHSRGWTVHLGAGHEVEFLTFDAVADGVAKATGVQELLITWPDSRAA